MTLPRKAPLPRSSLRAKRPTPRRREAPRWTPAEWEEANAALIARCQHRCECCGEPLNGRVERHHRKRRRDGGDRLSNVLALLPACHAYWTQHPALAKDRGLIVEPWADPAACRVLHFGEVERLLTDDGQAL